MVHLADLPSLHKLVRASPTELEFRTPQRDFVRQGVVVWLLTFVLAGPIVSLAMLLMMALGMPEPEGDAELVPFGALGLLVFFGFGWGLVLMATQRHRAEKSSVRFDASRRLIQFPSCSVAWNEVEALVAAVRGQGSRSQRLELVLRPGGERLAIVRTRASIMPEELAVLTQRLAAQLGVVPHVTWQNQNVATRSRYTFGLDASEKLYVLATLFVPFGALFTALTQRRGSLVRFVALQELTRFFATLAIVVLGAAGSAVLIRPEAGPGARSALVREPALAVLLCLLSLLVVGSVLGAVVAVARAFDGEAWIIPGLGPLVHRFVPESRPLAAAGAGLLPVAPTGVSGGLERATTPWPKTTISQTVATTLTVLGVTFLALMTCGIGTYDWFSLPNYPVPPSKFRSAQLREIAQLVELQPGEELAYVGVWGFFDLAAGMSVLTSRRVLVYDPETSPKLQSIELFLIESVRLQPSSEWTEPSRLIVSGAGRKLELPLWDSERGDRKFFDALEKARTRAKPR